MLWFQCSIDGSIMVRRVPCSVDLWFGSRVPSGASIVEHFATGGFTVAVGKPHTEFFRKSKTGLAISPFAKVFFEMIYIFAV